MSNVANATKTGIGSAVAEISDVTTTHVTARRGARAALAAAARTNFGDDFPSTPRATQASNATIVWAGPEQWLVIQKREGSADPSVQLRETFRGLASVVDVSDSRKIFRMSCSRPSDALVRSLGVDFADDVFRPGDVAITHASHLGLMVWRLPDGSGYDFACARTYARDFLDWIGKV